MAQTELRDAPPTGASRDEAAPRSPSAADNGLAAARKAASLLPQLALTMAVGLLIIAIAGNLSRIGADGAEPLFWLGLGLVCVPTFARLLGTPATGQERLGLVALLGLSLYWIKLLHSPTAFTFLDEFIHVHNLAETVQNQHLFQDNTVQPITSVFPGLASAAAALVSLSGLSFFAAGLVLIGVARLIFLIALFLLIERVSASARIAGITTALYTANPNFLFYSAEFGYEQLALPLAMLSLFAIVRRTSGAETRHRLGWSVVAILSLLATVVTHHLTAYILVGAVWLICLLYSVYLKQSHRAPWDVAVIGLIAALAWLAFVATPTVFYLSQIVGGAAGGALQVFTTGQVGRQLFEAPQGGTSTPAWEQLLGIGAVVLIVVGLPSGVLYVLRRHGSSPFALLFAAAGLLYPPVQLLRFTRFGWETSTRSAEFLFIGVGFLLALAVVGLHGRWPARMHVLLLPALTMYAVVIFAGGVVAGWSSDLRLPRPYLVSSGGTLIEPAGVTVARWSRAELGTDNVFAADPSSALNLLAYGDQRPLTGDARGIRSVFFTRTIDSTVADILRNANVRYLAFDPRLIAWNPLLGVYPPRPGDQTTVSRALLDPDAVAKFDKVLNVNRIVDAGDLVIYDVGALSNAPHTN